MARATLDVLMAVNVKTNALWGVAPVMRYGFENLVEELTPPYSCLEKEGSTFSLRFGEFPRVNLALHSGRRLSSSPFCQWLQSRSPLKKTLYDKDKEGLSVQP